MSVNQVTLLGRVGKDVEIKDINGAKCAIFSLATSERYKDRNGEQKELTEWHNIVAWRQTADICEKYVKKGDQVCILGRIRYRSWESNGEKKYATDIVADRVDLLGKGAQSPATPTPTPAPTSQRPQYKTTPIVDDLPDDDSGLPFN